MQSLQSYEKATGNQLGSVQVADEADIEAAVARARTAGRIWATQPVQDRLRPLPRLRARLVSAADELGELLSRENGKPRHESWLHEVVPLIDAIGWLEQAATEVARDQAMTPRWLKHRSHLIRSRPRGVTAILSPFNFPLLIAGFDALTALAMGNTVIVKPSEHCPLVVERFVQLAHEAGIDGDVLQVVHGGPAVGSALLDAAIDAVVFTGSSVNGRQIAVRCAERLRHYTLELGGNCPLVVLDDAEIDRTARAIVFGALANSGQSCLAVGRVLVPRALEQPLAERVHSLVSELRQGDPLSGPVELGALTTRAQVERCRDHVLEALANGARKLGPTQEHEARGPFFPPTVLTQCTPANRVYREETFGPVIPFFPYDDETCVREALNREPSGLGAYVFGTDSKRAVRYAEELDYGHVLIDAVLLSYVCPEVPLSGLRMSGQGVVHGTDGLLAHRTPRVIGTPKLRLPSAVEFDLLDPERAESMARAYLSSQKALGLLSRWRSHRS